MQPRDGVIALLLATLGCCYSPAAESAYLHHVTAAWADRQVVKEF